MRLTRMIPNTLLLGALAGIIMFAQSAASGHQRPKPSEGNERWVPATFHGIRVGKSTSEDVIRTFGKPDGKDEVEELVVPSDKDGEVEARPGRYCASEANCSRYWSPPFEGGAAF
jgi:hypothetical protein